MWAKLQSFLGSRQQEYHRVAESELAHVSGCRAGASCALLAVQGMTCSACSLAVENALREVKGVSKVEVSVLRHSAEVHFEGSQCSPEQLVAAVEGCGFDCRLQSLHSVDTGDADTDRLQTSRLHVGGMTCGACSGSVERGLAELPGVSHAAVSLTQHEAEVTHSSDVTPEALVAAVEDMGFEAYIIATAGREEAVLAVSGMTCGACSGSVESALRAVPGVSAADVSVITGKAQVWYNPTSTGPRAFIDAVTAAGFEASLLDEGSGSNRGAAEHAVELASWRQLFWMAMVFTVPVFMLSMVMPMWPVFHGILAAPVLGFRCDELLKWVLATPVQFWIGWRFHKGAWKALRRGVANMNVLVALGTDASYFYSVISILHHRFVQHDAAHYVPTDFFETCAMLITVVILGKYMECQAKGKTSEAIQALMALAPESAVLVELDEDNRVVSEETTSSRLVHHGDLLKVLPGGRIPADGVLRVGSSYINEAMITGESQPVEKKVGDAVIGGTINQGNALIMQATRVGADTVLSQIVRLVERAQLSKAPIQAYADWVASIFVPVVVGLAFTTWAAWYIAGKMHAFPDSWLPMGHTPFLFALLFGIAVLVIACPCALGLATPTAVMVGTGVGAQLGILIKGGDALERGYNVNTIVFDKTGTLTLGKPQVMEAAVFDSHYTLAQVCELAAATEASSEHPLARAVLEFSEARLASPDPGGKPVVAWTFDFRNDASNSSSNSNTSSGVSGHAHAPSTPPNEQQRAFTATFCLEDDHSGSSTPAKWHADFPAGSACNPINAGGSNLQLVDVPLASPRTADSTSCSAAAFRPPGRAHGAQHWSAAAGGGYCRRSSAPNSPRLAGSKHAQHHIHANGRVSLGGGMPSTPGCLRQLLSNGLLRVSEVQAHPGKGVTTVIPVSAALQSRKSAAGNTHALNTTGSSGGGGAAPAQELHLALGNRRLMQERLATIGPDAAAFMRDHEAQAHTCVLVGINGSVVAALAIADPLKPEARSVVAALQAQRIQVHLLTGDNKATAHAIARELAIPSAQVSAEVLPGGKASVVGELQNAGRVVAMVGDGINDSPALAKADVGIAIGSGTDIAVEAADYVLMRDNLEQVLIALDLSRKTFARIRWNFCWALMYNVLMIPIAAGVLYPNWRWKMPPWVAGGCMVFSSVSVVLSSLMLRFYKPPRHLLLKGLADIKVQ